MTKAISGTALITGASGFIGTRLRDALLDAGVDVVTLRRRSSKEPSRGRSVVGDYGDVGGLARVITAAQPDYVFHVAGVTKGRAYEDFRAGNVMPTESMVSAVREQHAVPDRGVHSAPFYVLIGANMPAILAELAFVSHPEDEKRLRTPEYREVLARSLARGLASYLASLDRTRSRQLTDAARRPTVAGGR